MAGNNKIDLRLTLDDKKSMLIYSLVINSHLDLSECRLLVSLTKR